MGVSGNSVAGKSYQIFTVSEELLAKVVEAVQAGEKEARSSGNIQSFEVFCHGFRQNTSLGRIMVVPAKVCNDRQNFPTALLHGALVRVFGWGGEEIGDLIDKKIGDSEFDEYSQADFDTLKKELFVDPRTGEEASLVVFAPNWMNSREYICFHFTKDAEALRNNLRHQVFAAYYNPAVSSAFNALMTNVNTTKVDVTDITPKLSYPFLTENPLKEFPQLEKTAGWKKATVLLNKKTADAVTKETLDPQELDVFDSLNQALEQSLMPEADGAQGEGGFTAPTDKGGVPREASKVAHIDANGVCPGCKKAGAECACSGCTCKQACSAHEVPFTNVGPGTEAAAKQQAMAPAVKEELEFRSKSDEKKLDGGGSPVGIAIDETGVPRSKTEESEGKSKSSSKTAGKKEAKPANNQSNRKHDVSHPETQRVDPTRLSSAYSAAYNGGFVDKHAMPPQKVRDYMNDKMGNNAEYAPHAVADHQKSIEAGAFGEDPLNRKSNEKWGSADVPVNFKRSNKEKMADYIADVIATEVEDDRDAISAKGKKARTQHNSMLNKFRPKQAVELDIDSIWDSMTEDMGPAPLVELDGENEANPAPSNTEDQGGWNESTSEGEQNAEGEAPKGRPNKRDVQDLPEFLRSDKPEESKAISDNEAESQESNLENSATQSEEHHESEEQHHEGAWRIDEKFADFVGEVYEDYDDEAIDEATMKAAQDAIDNDDTIIYDVAANAGQIVDNVKHMSWFVEAVARELQEQGAADASFQQDDVTQECMVKEGEEDNKPGIAEKAVGAIGTAMELAPMLANEEKTATGEMSQQEADDPEAWPLHHAIAQALGGKVKAFDQYQGPYVLIGSEARGEGVYAPAIPMKGTVRLWIQGDGGMLQVYNEDNEKLSEPFNWDDTEGAIEAAKSVLDGGDQQDEVVQDMAKSKQQPEVSEAEKLMLMEDDIWQKLGIESGGELRQNPELMAKYKEEMAMALKAAGISRVSTKVLHELENENFHSLMALLIEMGMGKYASRKSADTADNGYDIDSAANPTSKETGASDTVECHQDYDGERSEGTDRPKPEAGADIKQAKIKFDRNGMIIHDEFDDEEGEEETFPTQRSMEQIHRALLKAGFREDAHGEFSHPRYGTVEDQSGGNGYLMSINGKTYMSLSKIMEAINKLTPVRKAPGKRGGHSTPNEKLGITPEQGEQMIQSIKHGDKVTILRPAGMGREGMEWKEATGKAVMHSSHGGWVLNMGGQHGTPGLADAGNIVRVRKGKAVPGQERLGSDKTAAYTTFPNEEVILEAPTGEVLVKGDTAQGRRYIAIAADMLRTDYPLMYEHNKQVVWDNPEWFSDEFKAAVAKHMRSGKTADTADNAANWHGGEGIIQPKTDAVKSDTTGPDVKSAGSDDTDGTEDWNEKGRREEEQREKKKKADGIEGDAAEAKAETVSPDSVDKDIQQPTVSVSEAAKVAGTWMNEYEIDEAMHFLGSDPLLGKYVRFLAEFKDQVNSHSDGWPYWKAPAHAAGQLMTLLKAALDKKRGYRSPEAQQEVTEQMLRKAMGPIKAFYTRRGTAAGMEFPKLAADVSGDFSEAKAETVSPDTVDSTIQQPTVSVEEAGKSAAAKKANPGKGNCDECGSMRDLDKNGLCGECRSEMKSAAIGERNDDVPVSEGAIPEEKQPTSDLSGAAPEAHDVPPQVDSAKQACDCGAFSPESVEFDFGTGDLADIVMVEPGEKAE